MQGAGVFADTYRTVDLIKQTQISFEHRHTRLVHERAPVTEKRRNLKRVAGKVTGCINTQLG